MQVLRQSRARINYLVNEEFIVNCVVPHLKKLSAYMIREAISGNYDICR
jgi:hypothetical protein